MKKQIILSAVATVLLTGCFGSGSGAGLSTPVKQREQSVDAKVMPNIKEKAPQEFAKNLQNPKYSNVKTVSFAELKKTNEKLYNFILPIAQEAQKMYKQRALPKDIVANGADWLSNDLGTLNVTTLSSNGGFNGRYSPYNDLLIMNFDKATDEDMARFLIAHEFAHAIALHVSEERTTMQQRLDGSEDTSILALDIAFNEAYTQLDSKTAKMLDLSAEQSFSMFFDQEDLANEQKIIQERANGFTAQAAKAAGQADKLNMLGVDLAIPLKTKMLLRYLNNTGLDSFGALDALKGGVEFTSANVITITGHPKEQEMEADSIALALLHNLGHDVKQSACKRFATNKEAGMFDAHPSYSDRRANLGCAQ